MKLITEAIEKAEYIVEEKNGKKDYKIRGIFLQSEIKNRNGRVYPKETLAKEVSRYNREFVEQKRAFGELGHPDGPTVNLERVSHMITNLYPDGNNFIGEAKIMDTPYGKIVKNLIDEDSFPNCMIITGNKCIGKKDLAQEIAKYYLDDKTSTPIDSNVNFKLIKIEKK